MEQNSRPVVGEATKPAGIDFDELDGAVEALGAGVADSVLAEVQQSFPMAPFTFISDADQGISRRALQSQPMCSPASNCVLRWDSLPILVVDPSL